MAKYYMGKCFKCGEDVYNVAYGHRHSSRGAEYRVPGEDRREIMHTRCMIDVAEAVRKAKS